MPCTYFIYMYDLVSLIEVIQGVKQHIVEKCFNFEICINS